MKPFNFTDYLLSKQSVDDRALNQHVFKALKNNLPQEPSRIIELGGGIGSMIPRLMKWDLIKKAEYVLVDEMPENADSAAAWIPRWATEQRLGVASPAKNIFKLSDSEREIQINIQQADLFDFIQEKPAPADLLICHAVLDLLPMPESLQKMFGLMKPNSLAWLTINFDGVTSLEPHVEPALDTLIESLYHQSMDERSTGGDSRSGRHLFEHINVAGGQVLAAGASDWVVHAVAGKYPADEEYFLNCILHFFEDSLSGNKALDAAAFAGWLAARREQIKKGELVYIAHQMDFLVRKT